MRQKQVNTLCSYHIVFIWLKNTFFTHRHKHKTMIFFLVDFSPICFKFKKKIHPASILLRQLAFTFKVIFAYTKNAMKKNTCLPDVSVNCMKLLTET